VLSQEPDRKKDKNPAHADPEKIKKLDLSKYES